MDELAQASPEDPRVTQTAHDIVVFLPAEVVDAVGASLRQTPFSEQSGFAAAFFADLTPAQAQTLREVIQLLQERADEES